MSSQRTIDVSDRLVKAMPDDAPVDVWEFVDCSDWEIRYEIEFDRASHEMRVHLDEDDRQRISDQCEALKKMLEGRR